MRMVIEAQALHGFPSKHPVVHELYWQHPGKRFVRAIGSEDPDYIGRWRMYDGVREWPRGGRVRRLMPDYVMGPRRANAVATLVTQGKAELRGRETMLGIETQVVDLAWDEHDLERYRLHPQTGVVMAWDNFYRGERTSYLRVLEIDWYPVIPEDLFDPP